VRGLYSLGWPREEVLTLFHILDWLLNLSPDQTGELWSQIERIEEEKKMEFIGPTTISFLEKGRQEGLRMEGQPRSKGRSASPQ